jgi:transposase
MTQQEVADALGVSRWTVDRWLNREQLTPMALSPRERWMLFGLGYSGNPDEVTHYARLLALERESETDVLTEEPEDGDVPFPEDFSL